MQRYFLSFCLVLIGICSCEKPAGEGGTASINGTLMVDEYRAGFLVGSYGALEERVYIVYGENEIYDDVIRTNYDGQYQFNYLYPGDYTLFAYSDCDTCISGEKVVLQTVEITDRGQDLEAPVMTIKQIR